MAYPTKVGLQLEVLQGWCCLEQVRCTMTSMLPCNGKKVHSELQERSFEMIVLARWHNFVMST